MKEWYKSNKKLILIVLSIILFFCLLAFLFYPRFYLNKGDVETLYNKKYKSPGYKAYNIFTKLDGHVNIKSNVNTKKVGTYKETYKFKYLFFNKTITRKVKVVEKEKPVITLLYDNEEICKNKFTEYKYSATDNYDGDITNKVSVKLDGDKIIYTVKDVSGNETKLVKNVKFKTNNKPVIELKGSNPLYLYKGKNYEEPGFNATDECEGDLSKSVKITNNIDVNKVGTYSADYEVSNSIGTIAKVSRKVIVYDGESGGSGVIYLTFDDGPSASITPALLDILKEEGVKATFFVINHSDNLNYLIKREHDEGHKVALHSYTHNYGLIYSSVDNYFDDLYKIKDKVKNITGVDTNIIRFPGGSSNTVSKKYSMGIMSTLTKEVINKGFIYFDWNIGSGDSGGAQNSSQVYNNVVNNLKHNRANVVLMHDFENNYKTLNAIRDIIKFGKQNGYAFDVLNESSPRVTHSVNN